MSCETNQEIVWLLPGESKENFNKKAQRMFFKEISEIITEIVMNFFFFFFFFLLTQYIFVTAFQKIKIETHTVNKEITLEKEETKRIRLHF